jgi:hypothetical protein
MESDKYVKFKALCNVEYENNDFGKSTIRKDMVVKLITGMDDIVKIKIGDSYISITLDACVFASCFKRCFFQR